MNDTDATTATSEPPALPAATSALPAATSALTFAAPVVAIVFSAAVVAVFLLVSGEDPATVLSVLAERAALSSTWIDATSLAVPLYLSATAAAIGFKMNLFNIGVEGQYRLAMLIAALAGAAVDLPAPLHVTFIIVVAMATGAAWATIAGVLNVRRGVNVVITTIMLNYVAIGVIAWIFDNTKATEIGDLNAATEELPPSAWMPHLVEQGLRHITGFALVAVALGVTFYLVVSRTRFGFRLRASGRNASAALTSGIDAGRMVLVTMALSGAIAGLVGLPQLLGEKHAYTADMTTGLGFSGITVALMGRNDPFGMALAALLIGFLNAAARYLDLEGIPKEIVLIMQGIIVLSVVVMYEITSRYKQRLVLERSAPSLETATVAAEVAA